MDFPVETSKRTIREVCRAVAPKERRRSAAFAAQGSNLLLAAIRFKVRLGRKVLER